MGYVQGKQSKLSKRRLCGWLRLRRSTLYEQKERKAAAVATGSDPYFTEMMKKIRRENQAWGFRLLFAYMKNQGEKLGKRRAHWLYKAAKLSLYRNPKKPRIKRIFEELLPPEKINEGWRWIF